MIDWTARARAFSERCHHPAPKTPTTRLSGVLGATSAPFQEIDEVVSGVSVVRVAPVSIDRDHATLTADLVEAAMRVCDEHGDGQAARDEMRADCLALSPRLQADLLNHFRGKAANLGRPKPTKADISAPSPSRACAERSSKELP